MRCSKKLEAEKPISVPPTTKGADSAPQRALRVGFVLVQPFTLTTLAGFIDALRLAADDADRSRQIHCTWSVLGESTEEIVSSCGVAVRPTMPMSDPTKFDYVVVVGGMLHHGQKLQRGTYSFLKKAAEAGVTLVGLCTGSFVLARAGLLDGYRACISRFHLARFKEEFRDLEVQSSRMFFEDRDRITCAGGASSVHLAAHLIAKHLNRTKAAKCLRLLYIDSPGPVNAWQSDEIVGDQAIDLVVRRAMQIIEENLSRPLSLLEISAGLGINLRQLERRFRAATGMTPRDYGLRRRLARANWLIENTTDSLTQIALETGFNNCSHFSSTFRKHFNGQPSRIRRQGSASLSG